MSASVQSSHRTTIHWVSPLPPLQTDIAHYTRRILPALASKADVVLWTSQTAWSADVERYASVRRFDPLARRPMDFSQTPSVRNQVNAIFFNIGNSWVFHKDIYLLSRRVPGVTVLHDLVLQEFFRDLVANKAISPGDYVGLMSRYYGADGATAAQAICDTGRLDPETFTRFPMFEAAIDNAVAVLTHTHAGAREVAGRRLTPSYRLDLPFEARPKFSHERAESGPLRLVQFGHIGPNRRLVQIIEALASVAADVDFQFEILGAVWNHALIERTIASYGLKEKVRIRGFVEEAALDAAIAGAHLVFNLRHPTMGEASGSQLRIWDHASLSVVTRIGWYDELPDDCVLKISLEDERAEIADLVRSLAQDRVRYRLVSQAGRRRLEERHNPDLYAEGVMDVVCRFRQDVRDRLVLDATTSALRRIQPEGALLSETAALQMLQTST